MMANLNGDELSIIFKFLNGFDLHNASLVCSFWSKIAKEESKRRGYPCEVKTKFNSCIDNWDTLKTQLIDCCQVKPSLHILFYGFGNTKQLPKGCYCQYLPSNCISISLEYFFTWATDNSISSIFFPEIPNLQISTISFNKHPWNKGIYCEELKCLFDDSFSNADRLKTIFEPIINDDFPTSGCIVFIYEIADNCILALAESLEKWFPNKKTSILGIATDKLSICNTVYNSHICQHTVDCTAILLNGTDMQSWILILENDSHNDERMEEFKGKINLRKHAIGFTASGYSSSYYFKCQQENLFKKYFPNVPIFQIYGDQAIARNDFKGLYTNLEDNFYMEETAALMLLTYN